MTHVEEPLVYTKVAFQDKRNWWWLASAVVDPGGVLGAQRNPPLLLIEQ